MHGERERAALLAAVKSEGKNMVELREKTSAACLNNAILSESIIKRWNNMSLNNGSRVKKYDLDKFIYPKSKEGTQFTNECEIETLKYINTICEKIYDLTIYESLEFLEGLIQDLENDEIPELSVKSPNNWTEIIDDKLQVDYSIFQFLHAEQYKVCYKRIIFLHWFLGTLRNIRIRSKRCEMGYLNYTDMSSAEYLKNRTIDIILNENKKKAVKCHHVSKCPADNCMGMLDDNMTCKLCHARCM